MNNLIPNTTQIPNIIIDEWLRNLTAGEFAVLIVIARQTYGWHKEREWIAYSQLIKKTGLHKETVSISIKGLKSKGFIEVTNSKGESIEGLNLSGRRQLYYKVKVGKSDLLDNERSENPTFKGRKIRHTKETNTKEVSLDTCGKKLSTCPLDSKISFTSLREKYPNGHKECVEYLLEVEKEIGHNFVNKGTQFKTIHNILKAGFSFKSMNWAIDTIKRDEFYIEKGWDFNSVARFLERKSHGKPQFRQPNA